MSICLKDYVNFWVETPHNVLLLCYVWKLFFSTNGDINYLLCRLISQNHLNNWGLFMLCHHLSRLDGHKLCDNREMFLVCHVVKSSGDYIDKSPSRQVIIISSLVTIGTLIMEISWFSFVMWSCKTTWLKVRVTL